MYRKNLQTTTGRSPVKMNDQLISKFHTILNKIYSKGSRYVIAAFLLLTLPLMGCDSPGSVGEGLGPDGSDIHKEVYPVTDFTTLQTNFFSGRLQNSAFGYVEDPSYGTLNATALLKPSISRSQVDTLYEDDTLALRIVLNPAIYGETTGDADFEIYEVAERWRGNAVKYNEEIEVDFSSLVGEFSIAEGDTIVEAELSEAWTNKFADYFNNRSADRDSLYSREFFGLAVVSAGNTRKMHFLSHIEQSEENPEVTSLILYRDDEGENGNDDNGDDNGEEEEEEGPPRISLLDYGSSVIRSDAPEGSGGIVLRNIDQITRMEFSLPKEELSSKNIVSAKLILSPDPDADDAGPGFVRPAVETIRAHTFRTPPSNVMNEIFINSPRFGAEITEEGNLFQIDVTQYVLNEVYGDVDEGPVYVSIQNVNGILFSSTLFDETAPDNRKPRLIITTVE